MNIRNVGLLEVAVTSLVVACTGCGNGDSNGTPSKSDGGSADAAGNLGWLDASSPDSGAGLDGGGSSLDDASVAADAAEGSTAVVLPGPSHGASVALSPDDSVAVVANRDVGSVTVFKMSYVTGAPATATVVGEISVGAGSEPWQVAISPDNTTAYVVLRRDQKLAEITGLQSTPVLGRSVGVGSEPTAVALTPTGAKAWVANWVDGTIMGIDTASMKVDSAVDLNAPLVASGTLGTVTPRPALAHPRSLAITNNGNASDDDESIYVTEYYGQTAMPEASDGSNADTHKVGIVYRVKISDKSVSIIKLAPLADMGFKDERTDVAGCYPNQLQSITLNGGFGYVTSVCASPKGPTGPRVTTTATRSCTSTAAYGWRD